MAGRLTTRRQLAVVVACLSVGWCVSVVRMRFGLEELYPLSAWGMFSNPGQPRTQKFELRVRVSPGATQLNVAAEQLSSPHQRVHQEVASKFIRHVIEEARRPRDGSIPRTRDGLPLSTARMWARIAEEHLGLEEPPASLELVSLTYSFPRLTGAKPPPPRVETIFRIDRRDLE